MSMLNVFRPLYISDTVANKLASQETAQAPKGQDVKIDPNYIATNEDQCVKDL